MIHDFKESLKLSQEHSSAPWWEPVYKSAFPGYAGMYCVRNDGWAQRGGIDRVVVLKSGKTLTVDEKVRKEDWPDVLLERWSDVNRKTPGWIQKDLACDFIAYAYIPSRTCYLLPFVPLRRAWLTHGKDWIERHKEIRALNQGYVTASVAVPTDELFKALSGAMVVSWAQ